MRCRWVSSFLFVLSLAISPGHAQVDAPADGGTRGAAPEAARAAAQEWLGHVDAGAWEAAWEAVAPGLRDTVAQERWKQRGVRARNALGPVRSRKLMRTRYHDTVSRATDAGPLVLLQYHSTFGPDLYAEHVLAIQTDGAWRVAGYEVAPVTGRSRDANPN